MAYHLDLSLKNLSLLSQEDKQRIHLLLIQHFSTKYIHDKKEDIKISKSKHKKREEFNSYSIKYENSCTEELTLSHSILKKDNTTFYIMANAIGKGRASRVKEIYEIKIIDGSPVIEIDKPKLVKIGPLVPRGILEGIGSNEIKLTESLFGWSSLFRKKEKKSKIYLLMDRFPGVPLSKQSFIRHSMADRFDVSLSLLEGLKKLHDNNIIHGDLGSDNVIYDPETNQCHIIDYGASHELRPGNTEREDEVEYALQLAGNILLNQDLIMKIIKNNPFETQEEFDEFLEKHPEPDVRLFSFLAKKNTFNLSERIDQLKQLRQQFCPSTKKPEEEIAKNRINCCTLL